MTLNHADEIFERFGYDPDDPARDRDVPGRLSEALSESAAQGHEPTETLDEFMLRMADVKAPNSLKRIAWATGKTMQEVVDDLSDLSHDRGMIPDA